MVSYEDRKLLHDRLKTLVKSEYEQIFRILKANSEQYTENSNGIFFDITTISNTTCTEMIQYIDFCIENRNQEQTRIKELATLSTTFLQDTSSTDESHSANVMQWAAAGSVSTTVTAA